MTHPSVFRKLYFYYSLGLFVASIACLWLAVAEIGMPTTASPAVLSFFLILSLYTICVGYPHPVFGYVSFDRVGQVATILVLGPVLGTIVSGVASFIYPIHRLAKGVNPGDVLTACLHNSGLMIFATLAGGIFYTFTGGFVPLEALNFSVLTKLVGLMLVMQIVNELGMFVYLIFHGGNPKKMFNAFSTTVELGSGLIGVLVALSYSHSDKPTFILLLAVLAVGMLVIQRYALMRNKLESLVQQRTIELQKKSEELERKATHDKLTGLHNRRYADDFLEREIELAIQRQENFTVALADIDHFKQVNDHHSHEVGDSVLMQVAELLSSCCRSTDTIARYGGEEFLFCFPCTNASDAHAICEKLRIVVENHNWSGIAPNIDITLSFGVAQIDPNSRRKSILREADKHLYAAKNLGRNRVVA